MLNQRRIQYDQRKCRSQLQWLTRMLSQLLPNPSLQRTALPTAELEPWVS